MSNELKEISIPVITIGGKNIEVTSDQWLKISDVLNIKEETSEEKHEKLIESIKSLNLDKPICFFDIESTGLDKGADRCVSISVIKVMPDGEMINKKALINPMIPIKQEAFDVHGISNEMVEKCPKFSQIAKSMYDFLKGCYLAGYNNGYFDNSMLQEEFLRCEPPIEFPPNDIIYVDSCSIFKYFEKRDLSAALKFYCNEEMENAHDADADNNATIKIFFAQIQRYKELKGKTIQEIAKICRDESYVDFEGRVVIDKDGDYAWGFGKNKGSKIRNEMGFGDWVIKNNFPQSFKNLVSKILVQLRG